MNLIVLKNKFLIYKFSIVSPLPDWICSSDFYSITKTKDEFSVVTLQTNSDSENIISSKDWRIFKVAGPLDFSLTGVIAEISNTLKNKNIPIFTISTYDTDFILDKQKDLESSIIALKEKGHDIILAE